VEPLHIRLAKKKGPKDEVGPVKKVTSLSMLPKVTLSNVRNDFTKDIGKDALEFHDILAFKSMQPHPLRDNIFRMQTEGQFMNLAQDVRGNQVKITYVDKIASLIERTTG
jgi:hypothetical protein